MKSKKHGKYYLLSSDIEELHERYGKLYKQIITDFENEEITQSQIKESSEVLLATYRFEVAELNDLREVEYLKRKAAIDAKNKKQIPWRRCWLWRLLFRPLTNRPQDIIEERAALEAETEFENDERELDTKWQSLYGDEIELSGRKRKKLLKKYLKFKRLIERYKIEKTSEPAAPAVPGNVPDVPPAPPAPELPTRQPRR